MGILGLRLQMLMPSFLCVLISFSFITPIPFTNETKSQAHKETSISLIIGFISENSRDTWGNAQVFQQLIKDVLSVINTNYYLHNFEKRKQGQFLGHEYQSSANTFKEVK